VRPVHKCARARNYDAQGYTTPSADFYRKKMDVKQTSVLKAVAKI